MSMPRKLRGMKDAPIRANVRLDTGGLKSLKFKTSITLSISGIQVRVYLLSNGCKNPFEPFHIRL